MTRAHGQSRARVSAQVAASAGEVPRVPCEADPELMFPGKGESSAPQIAAAKAVCAGCEVKAACLKASLDLRIPFGVWGGVDQVERRKILRRQVRKDRKARATEQTVAATSAPPRITERIQVPTPPPRPGMRLNETRPRSAAELATYARLRAEAEAHRIAAVHNFADTPSDCAERLHVHTFTMPEPHP